MASARRVLVVEDEFLTAGILRKILTDSGFAVRLASDVITARAEIDSFNPHAVILDISLGVGPSGLDLGHVIGRTRPDIAQLYLTQYPGGSPLDRVPPRAGFLSKDRLRQPDYLVAALHLVLNDEPELARGDLHTHTNDLPLTGRQVQLLRMVALGMTDAEIAEAVRGAESTVARWLDGIYRELGIDPHGAVEPRAEAVRRYLLVFGQPD